MKSEYFEKKGLEVIKGEIDIELINESSKDADGSLDISTPSSPKQGGKGSPKAPTPRVVPQPQDDAQRRVAANSQPKI